MMRKRLRYSTASAAISVWRASSPKLSRMFSAASATARSEESTEQTSFAPPERAYTEKPPV